MNKRRVAVHEAGHALVAYLQGGDLYSATIEPAHEYEGQVESEIPEFDGAEFDHDDSKDKLRTLYAGGEAERLVFGDGEPSEYDRERIADLGISHAPKNEAGVRDTAVFAEQAYEMLEEHREALEVLAEYLLDEETLDGEEVEVFLDERLK